MLTGRRTWGQAAARRVPGPSGRLARCSVSAGSGHSTSGPCARRSRTPGASPFTGRTSAAEPNPEAARSAAAVEHPRPVAGDGAEAGGDGGLEAGRIVGVEDEVVDDERARRIEEIAGARLALLAGA